ncbi:MAG TPA: coproporphyrinogen III oxidase, partial [Gemmatimonadales bacterium]
MAAKVTEQTGLRGEVAGWIERLHDQTTEYFKRLDRGGSFREDRWERPGGGGGVSRVLSDGVTFEKAGVNRSTVEGPLDPQLAQRIGARTSGLEPLSFSVSGLSLVIHPRSPLVPTVHLNVRYFEIARSTGEPVDAWFGGGTDLTPTYPFPEDASHFHRTLKAACDRHHPTFYPRFKTWCDHYFVNTHRGDERRGIGGIFFDNLRAGESGLSLPRLFHFVTGIGEVLPEAYGPLV